MTTLRSLLLLCLAVLPALGFAQLIEEEPNNNLFQAQTVGPNESVDAFYNSNFDWDFFRVDLPEYGRLQATVVNTGIEPLSIAIVRSNPCCTELGDGVDTPDPAGPQWQTEKCCLAPGTYYVRVRASSPVDNDSYTLEMVFTPYDGINDEDTFLDNETAVDAAPLDLDETYVYGGVLGFDDHAVGITRDQEDWFEVELPLRSNLFIDSLYLSQEYDALCASFELNAPDYKVFLAEGVNGSGAGVVNDDFQATCIAAGTVYINWEDGGFLGIEDYCYGYGVEGHITTVPAGADAADDKSDNTIEDAIEIEATSDQEYIGYLGHKYFAGITEADTFDWFKFTTTGPGTTALTVEWDPEIMTIAVDFYSADGTTLPFPQSVQNGDGFDVTTFDCLNAGIEVFVRVRRVTGTCGDYVMAFQTPLDGDPIPQDDNDTPETATEASTDGIIDVSLGYQDYAENQGNYTDDEDYFRITIPDGTLSIEFDELDGPLPNYTFSLEDLAADPDDTYSSTLPFFQPSNITEFDDFARLTFDCMGAGTYLLKLTDAGAFECDQFELDFDMEHEATFDPEPDFFDAIPMEGSTVNGSIGHRFEQSSTCAISSDNSDKWVYTLEGGGNMYVDVTSEQSLNFDVDVFGPTGINVTDFGEVVTDNNGHWRWELDCLGEGEFTIDIRLDDGDCGAYTLDVFSSEAESSDTEPNDTQDQAQDLAVDTDQNGTLGMLSAANMEDVDHQDWYAVDWPGGELTIQLSSADSLLPQVTVLSVFEGNTEVLMTYTPLGEELPATDGYSSIEVFECLAAQSLLIGLNSAPVNGYGCGDYTLFVQTEEGTEPDPEPFLFASDLDDGQLGTNTGRLGDAQWFSFQDEVVFGQDYRDVWLVPLDEAGTLTLTLDAPYDFSPMGLGIIEVYADENLDTLIPPTDSSTDIETGAYTEVFGCLDLDEVYVEVLMGSPSGVIPCFDYSMELTQEAPLTFANDEEFNNTYPLAQEVAAGAVIEGRLQLENVENPMSGEEVLDQVDMFTFELEEFAETLQLDISLEGGVSPEEITCRLVHQVFLPGQDPQWLEMHRLTDVVGEETLVVTYDCLASGVYIVELYTESDACMAYRIETTIGEPFVDGDTSSQSSPLLVETDVDVDGFLGVIYFDGPNRSDFYQFQLGVGKALSIEVDDDIQGIAAMSLHYLGEEISVEGGDWPSETLINPVIPSEGETFDLFCQRPGFYGLEVTLSSPEGCGPYTFKVITDGLPDDLGEFNDTNAAASPLELGEHEATLLTYKTATVKDFNDHYTIAVPAGQGVELYVGQMNSLSVENPVSRYVGLTTSTSLVQSYSGNETFNWTSPVVNYDRTYTLQVGAAEVCDAYELELVSVDTELGDFDGSGETTTVDMLDILGNFGCMSECDPYDLNGDGVVDVIDLLIVMGSID